MSFDVSELKQDIIKSNKKIELSGVIRTLPVLY